MDAIYKNSRQEEFCVLMQRMEDLKFRPADVARMLNKTPGAISQYLSGKTNPSETVLQLFRMIVKEKMGPEPEPDQDVHQQLNDLNRISPQDFEAAKTMIRLLHQKLPASSSKEDASKRLLKKASASAPRRHDTK